MFWCFWDHRPVAPPIISQALAVTASDETPEYAGLQRTSWSSFPLPLVGWVVCVVFGHQQCTGVKSLHFSVISPEHCSRGLFICSDADLWTKQLYLLPQLRPLTFPWMVSKLHWLNCWYFTTFYYVTWSYFLCCESLWMKCAIVK